MSDAAENDAAPTAKIPHSRACMDAHMLPCRCGADEHNARVIPPAKCNCDGDDCETGHDLLCPRLATRPTPPGETPARRSPKPRAPGSSVPAML